MVRGKAVVLGGLGVVLRHSQSPAVERPGTRLRFGMPLFGGLQVPAQGLAVVLVDSLASLVRHAQSMLGCRVPRLRFGYVALQRLTALAVRNRIARIPGVRLPGRLRIALKRLAHSGPGNQKDRVCE